MAQDWTTKDNKLRSGIWMRWAIKHLDVMSDLGGYGILGGDKKYQNVADHLLVVNAASVLLAKKIKTTGQAINMNLVDKGSILHDIAKRFQRESGIFYDKEYSSNTTREILEKLGYPESVINVAEYTGRVPEIHISDDEKQQQAVQEKPLEHLIVAYVDARVRNTDIVLLEEARDRNKVKVPKDAKFYDQWYRFYKKVEERLFKLINNQFKPTDLNNSTVYTMIQEEVMK